VEEKLETKVFRAPLDFLNLLGSTPEMKPVAGPDPFAPADPFAPPAPPVQHRPLPSSRKVREAHTVVAK
jgi:hypothetical protein